TLSLRFGYHGPSTGRLPVAVHAAPSSCRRLVGPPRRPGSDGDGVTGSPQQCAGEGAKPRAGGSGSLETTAPARAPWENTAGMVSRPPQPPAWRRVGVARRGPAAAPPPGRAALRGCARGHTRGRRLTLYMQSI